MKRYRWLIQLAIVLAIFFGVRAYMKRDLVKGRFHPVQATTLTGKAVTLGGAGDGPTMLHVWASWCGVCKAVEGSVQDVSKDARVITVAVQSGSADDVRSYMKKKGLDFEVVNDPQGRIAYRLGVHAFPTTFFLSEAGDIRSADVGLATEWGIRARLWLAGL